MLPPAPIAIIAIELDHPRPSSPGYLVTPDYALWRVWLADGRAFLGQWVGAGHDQPEFVRHQFHTAPGLFAPLA